VQAAALPFASDALRNNRWNEKQESNRNRAANPLGRIEAGQVHLHGTKHMSFGAFWLRATVLRLDLSGRIASVVLAALLSVPIVEAAAVAIPSYTTDEMRRGVSKDSAVARFQQLGFKVEEKPILEGYAVTDATTNEVLGILNFCQNKLIGQSIKLPLGVIGFVRRAARLNQSHGQGTVQAEAALLNQGEYAKLRLSWQRVDELITISLVPESGGFGETQWITYSIPSSCK
jgi:hypothetical protein